MEVNGNLPKTKIEDKDIQKTVVAILAHNTRDEQAGALGITRQGLYKRLLRNPEINELASQISEKSHQIMQIASLKASYKLVELLDHPNPKVSIVAATQILDRVGVTIETLKDKSPLPEPILKVVFEDHSEVKQ